MLCSILQAWRDCQEIYWLTPAADPRERGGSGAAAAPAMGVHSSLTPVGAPRAAGSRTDILVFQISLENRKSQVFQISLDTMVGFLNLIRKPQLSGRELFLLLFSSISTRVRRQARGRNSSENVSRHARPSFAQQFQDTNGCNLCGTTVLDRLALCHVLVF